MFEIRLACAGTSIAGSFGRLPYTAGGARLLLAATVLLSGTLAWSVAADAAVRVVASIKPLHSLVSAVMDGAGEPHLIMQGTASPHTFSLRPSDARVIQDAEVVFLIGEALETSLAGSIDTLGRNARVVELDEAQGLFLRSRRDGATFEAHDDEEHRHQANEDPGAHDHGSFDMHVWLDPINAQAMVRAIADALSTADPENAALYATNAEAVVGRLDQLTEQISADAAPARGRPFIVFHDAYRYFEDRFGIAAAGSASVSPDRPPGARRIRELRDKVGDLGVVCVLAEPQFDPRLANVIIEGTPARLGTVDPLGAALEAGPDMYFVLLQDMAASFTNCLAAP